VECTFTPLADYLWGGGKRTLTPLNDGLCGSDRGGSSSIKQVRAIALPDSLTH
jgi:hypothetical protein